MLGSLGTVVKPLVLKTVIAVILVQRHDCSSWLRATVPFHGNKMIRLSRTFPFIVGGKWSLPLTDDFLPRSYSAVVFKSTAGVSLPRLWDCGIRIKQLPMGSDVLQM